MAENQLECARRKLVAEDRLKVEDVHTPLATVWPLYLGDGHTVPGNSIVRSGSMGDNHQIYVARFVAESQHCAMGRSAVPGARSRRSKTQFVA